MKQHDKQALFKAIDLKIYREISRYKFSLYQERPHLNYKEVKEEVFNHFLDYYTLDILEEAYDLVESTNKRRQRCYDKVEYLFNNYEYIFFGTLTFNDKTLFETNETTRRKYVSRYLKESSEYYIANVDYGDKEKNPNSNEREHYHCLIATKTNQPPMSWSYGFTKFQKVRIDDDSHKAISKYIVKLSRHALKQCDTTQAPKLIYSKVVAPYWLLD